MAYPIGKMLLWRQQKTLQELHSVFSSVCSTFFFSLSGSMSIKPTIKVMAWTNSLGFWYVHEEIWSSFGCPAKADTPCLPLSLSKARNLFIFSSSHSLKSSKPLPLNIGWVHDEWEIKQPIICPMFALAFSRLCRRANLHLFWCYRLHKFLAPDQRDRGLESPWSAARLTQKVRLFRLIWETWEAGKNVLTGDDHHFQTRKTDQLTAVWSYFQNNWTMKARDRTEEIRDWVKWPNDMKWWSSAG